jgi:protein gp37
MPANSVIAWSDCRWNLVRGCSKISPGCKNCQAKSYAERFRDPTCNQVDEFVDVQLVPQNLLKPLQRRRTSDTIFVSSRGDFFHKEVPDHFIVAAFEVMSRVDWHSYLVLTKRADRMRTMIESELQFAAKLDHIWWGVSVEDKKHGLPRIEALRNATVAKRFLSIEPLLEDLGTVTLDGIDWVGVSDERGRKARPIEADWVLSLRDQCVAAKVPFFFKPWGGSPNGKFDCLRGVMQFPIVPPFPSLAYLVGDTDEGDKVPPSFAERSVIRADLRSSFHNKGIVA